ncbi:hypothetical protein CI109_103589 [Kwoniella shandongensis]|uniref:Chromatin modification-related protein n=1 Tax=Kwoniella shandongensis TaxID=1734106 RepID=A0A5M6C7N7_9TREE|nr:uncharacterized protein CI109_000719 [Kwoniella shandongensis]KAA5531147.1 hypothetical protein CI109_000719 [Kwoniella shandongensis]
MPPRKSLSARSPMTTPRGAVATPGSRPQSTLKRSRSRFQPDPSLSLEPSLSPAKRKSTRARHTSTPAAVKDPEADVKPQNDAVDEGAEEPVDPEAELEAWQDFAADHYEMVEQLPLELHRNFRLLRELDDGSLIQMEKLHALVRSYAKQRLALADALNPPSSTDQPEAPKPDVDVEMVPEKPLSPASTAEHSPVEDPTQQTPGVPIPDGAGGLLVSDAPATDTQEASDTARLEFPSSSAEKQETGDVATNAADVAVTISPPAPPPANDKHTPLAAAASSEIVIKARPDGPYKTLPEIARLAREIVRTGEEKVAVAVGAYNAIDRHIRALDSALTAQEASILLGLRPSTLPSSNVDSTLNLVGDTGVLPSGANEGEGDDEEVTIGVGGGGPRKKKNKRGKKGQPKAEEPVESIEMGDGTDPWSIPADPNEPRYCYCQQVSYGQMIGCENEECPLEWFHLPCVGLQETPSGKWWCNNCRPKIGLGKGGAGTVAPKNVGVGGGTGRRKR